MAGSICVLFCIEHRHNSDRAAIPPNKHSVESLQQSTTAHKTIRNFAISAIAAGAPIANKNIIF
jgi:hypothetical protein